ncbi:DUF2442 domain-containing protein [Rubrivirga sp. S365]|uniref:DUF2442 domain-containing protein n=1 Tax=Rubrivirga litoralis TaxID=3075598 RepID=A0ABU3BP01_9BACT|nr:MULTISPECIES: DUF2442 domain-containing protein [unclassified Rubrivirga]MDT0630936.1 DUF2442 domain-containing protein [Rubrivirga sp. F394]MDT7856579.1 DUF2442 domain-containing protein [Rubrivirga sp. S365]
MALRTIVSARPAHEGVLHVRFASGEERLFDTRPFQRSDFFQRLADPGYFAQVRVEAGTVTWPEGHDFDPGTVFARGEEVGASAGRAR